MHRYGEDYWMEDIDEYDKKCKVEPLMRALKEGDTGAWINGRRRDHGAERAALPIWEGTKVKGGYLYSIWIVASSALETSVCLCVCCLC